MFIDIHCHLNLLTDIYKVVENAHKKNVEIMLTHGTNCDTNRTSLDLAQDFTDIKVALGLYPSDALKMTDEQISDEIKFIEKNKDKIIAIGEVGMDLKENLDIDRQKKIFEKFVKLAIKLDKPVIVHSRKAELECIEVLEKLKAKKVIMHCFSGNLKLVQRIIDNGWNLSVPTNVTFSEHFQHVVKMTPIGQLFCETDSPYLHPNKEFPNEPANVVFSYNLISEIKGLKLKDVEKMIEENYGRLFLH